MAISSLFRQLMLRIHGWAAPQTALDDLAGKVHDIEQENLIFHTIEYGTGNDSIQQVGQSSTAEEDYAVAFGQSNRAAGRGAFVEGGGNIALGAYSHCEGLNNTATNEYEHAAGIYNLSHNGGSAEAQEDPSYDEDDYKTVHSVGMGRSGELRMNAFEIMRSGDLYVYGVGGYDGTNPEAAQTLQQAATPLMAMGSLDEVDDVVVFSRDVGQPLFDEAAAAFLQGRRVVISDYSAAYAALSCDTTEGYISFGTSRAYGGKEILWGRGQVNDGGK